LILNDANGFKGNSTIQCINKKPRYLARLDDIDGIPPITE